MNSLTKLTAALFLAGLGYAVYSVVADEDLILFLRQPLNAFFIMGPMLAAAVYLGSYLSRRNLDGFRTGLIALAALLSVGTALGAQIMLRHQISPIEYAHDGAVQTEEAARFIRNGVNPYAADYRGTVFGYYADYFSLGARPNPAWDHYVYLPATFLLVAPSQSLAEKTIGWFDVRMVYFFAWAGAIALLAWLVPARYRDLAIIMTAFNPLTAKFFIWGYNDFVVLFYLVAAIVCLKKGSLGFSSLAIGLAVATKQSAWLFVPFYLAGVLGQPKPAGWKRKIVKLWPGLAAAVLLVAPFLLWSPTDFFDDVWRFASGSAALSYPTSGLGLGQWLVSSGVLRSQYDYWPAGIFQAILGVPLLILTLWRQRQANTFSNLFQHYGLLLFGVWFVARYFNDSHLGYLTLIFIISALLSLEHRSAQIDRPTNP